MARIYTTILGDTWDLIAYQQMGSEKYMKELMDANWMLTDILQFDAGTELTIPDIVQASDSTLPFWHSADDNSIWGEEAT